MAFLHLDKLSKAYGGVRAVNELSLAVERGSLVSLLGPSGCGKTTTLQMILGFIRPDSGRIALGGTDLVDVSPSRRGIGVVFQNYALFPHMSVRANVAFGLEMRGVPAREREARVDRMLDAVRLQGLEDRLPRQLSGGQQQRVALARALVIEPDLLLLDEPFSNLDAKLRDDLRLELRNLQRRLGITTILVTHDQGEALALSDSIAIMAAGSIIQTGPPHDAYERPGSAFASAFLGRTNLLPGEITAGADGPLLDLGGVRIAAPADGPLGRVTASLRPERVSLVAPGRGRIDGRVSAAVFQGTSWLYVVETDAGKLTVSRPNGAEPSHAEGDDVGLDWELRSLHVFEDGGRA